MKIQQTSLKILPEKKDLSRNAKTGVSLHCHTLYSKEMLDFLPFYAERIPIVSYFWRKEQEKYRQREGKKIDFSTGYWSPPMSEQEVYQIEKEQINQIGLDEIVSITDHDCIEANLKLIESVENKKAPISMEWTVPFEIGFFHLGIHNLPHDKALEISDELLNFTFAKERNLEFNQNRLEEIFEMLNQFSEILVVFNHPLWDIEMIGKEQHQILLQKFLGKYAPWIHALEFNGFRSWSENKGVIELSEILGIPLVTGGDRHGCQPNTVINLTNSRNFAEFVEEIRVDKYSQIVLFPEYKQPLTSRCLLSISEILKFYPEFPEGRKKWFDRVYYDKNDGNGLQKLSTHWERGGPGWLRWVISAFRFLGNKQFQPIFRLAQNQSDVVQINQAEASLIIKADVEELSPLKQSVQGVVNPLFKPRYD